jgi:hypothetical protein
VFCKNLRAGIVRKEGRWGKSRGWESGEWKSGGQKSGGGSPEGRSPKGSLEGGSGWKSRGQKCGWQKASRKQKEGRDMMRQKKEIRTEKDGGGRRETCETQEGDVIIITQSHDIQSI